jgi:uncharacterized protein involved in exopolysaccharide biosynthesis
VAPAALGFLEHRAIAAERAVKPPQVGNLMLQQARPVEIDEKLDLVAFIHLFRDYRWTIALSTVIVAALATAYAFLATPIFRAEVTVTVVQQKDEGVAGELSGQLGDIANLAGVSVGSKDEDAYKAVLASRNLIQKFIERYGLQPVLSGRKAKKTLTLWKAANKFHEDVLFIKDDSRKGTTVVSITWTDPVVAARWANDFLALCNELIRTKALDQAKRNVAYLTDQTGKTNSVEVQQALYTLVESETKKLMLANEKTEYAFAVADPAVAPEIRSSPKRTLLLLAGLGLGGFIGFSIAFVRARLAARRHSAAQAQ